MTKFTPGPWIYTLNPDGSATVTMPHDHQGKPCATCQANARLIAAAPEMFEALKEIAAELGSQYLTDAATVNVRHAAEAALELATGDSDD